MIVDKATRRTLEIKADFVEFRNPQWRSIMSNATNKALSELGLRGNESRFTIKFQKALLDEPGTLYDIQPW